MNIFSAVLRLVYPNKCMFCNEIIKGKEDKFICDDCQRTVDFCKDFKCCSRCGKPQISLGEKETCYRCQTKTYRPYKSATAVVKYNEKTSGGIKRYKDGNGEIIGEVMAHLMAERVKDVYKEINFDIIVGVAPNDKRAIKRGFDPVAVIAQSLRMELSIPYCKGCLVKIKKTEKQSKLDYAHRVRNLIGTIALSDNAEVKGKRVLLVDDVMTTGATIEECSYVLKKGGAREVFAVTFATRTKEPKKFNKDRENAL